MTNFEAQTYQNEYLPVGGTEVNAVVRVTASGSGTAGAGSARGRGHPPRRLRIHEPAAVEDALGPGGHRRRHRLHPRRRAFRSGRRDRHGREVYPGNGELIAASDATREAAKRAVTNLNAGGGTAIGQWLTCANTLFDAYPGAIHHAILLTDGQDQDESPAELDAVLAKCQGAFQCDCRGVGADWEVAELREIASALLGDVDLVREPEQMTADFTDMMQRSMGRAVNDVALRLWTPPGATVSFVKQVVPHIEDLTDRRTDVSDRIGDYPTGAWGDETREFHVCVVVPARAVGEEMLAARVHLVVDGEPISEAKVRAVWTEDEALSTRLNPEVVRSRGDAGYAEAVQDGIAALRDGDEQTAINKLGQAVQIAAALGDQRPVGRPQPRRRHRGRAHREDPPERPRRRNRRHGRGHRFPEDGPYSAAA